MTDDGETGANGDRDARVFEAAMRLAAARGWRGLALADIAAAAGIPLAEVAGRYPDKGAVLAGLSKQADSAAFAGAREEDRDQPARDRLLDALMRRFDALRPWREGLRAVRRDPSAVAGAAPTLMKSMTATLEAAGIPGDGPGGFVRAAGLAAIYLSALRVWLDDESEDQSATLAHLARRLEQADRLLATCRRCARPGRRAERDQPPEAPETGAATGEAPNAV